MRPTGAREETAGAIAAAVPFKWVAGDTVYGVGDIEQQLRRAGKGYVLGVSSAHVFHSWGKRRSVAGTAADIAATRRASDWKRLSAGTGTKGPRLHDWCYLELADLEIEQSNEANPALWTRGLLIRRPIADGDLAQRLSEERRRDGAYQWGLMQDAAEPERFVEYFLVESWIAHQRQHARVTCADEDLQAEIAAFVTPGSTPRVTHWLAASDEAE